jgi:hypothetical protein
MRRLALVAVVALLAGCVYFQRGGYPYIHPEPPTFSQYHLAGWQWQRVDRVLVLPFLNESGYTRAGEEVRAAFASELQKEGRFEVIVAPPDDQAVLAATIHRGGKFDEAAMLALAVRTEADVVVHGTVTQYSPYPRPRLGLILQAVGPQEAKVVASVDGLWDTTDAGLAERCRIYYRQAVRPRLPVIRDNVIPRTNIEGFAEDVALDSPLLFQRWVCHEAVLALQGKPVPGVVSLKPKSCAPATDVVIVGTQTGPPQCAPTATDGKVK